MEYTKEAIEKRKRRKEKRRKVITTFVYVIIIPLIVYNISLIIQSVIKPNKIPSFFGVKNFVIISGSMEPNLKIGDIVVTKNVEQENIQIGDVISFRLGQSVVTHRVTDIGKDENGNIEYITKGDNNNVEDSKTVTIEQIEGKSFMVIKSIGKIALVLQNKTIFLILMFIFFVFYINTSRRQERRRIRKMKRLAMEEIKKEQEARLNAEKK